VKIAAQYMISKYISYTGAKCVNDLLRIELMAKCLEKRPAFLCKRGHAALAYQ